MSDYVSYEEMAMRLGLDPTTIRRMISLHGAELGIIVQKGKGNTSNAKWTHYLTRDDADRLASFYETRSTRSFAVSSDEPLLRTGFFYIIQLVPEALPNRIKIGYTDSIDKRIAEHQTAAPTARLLKSWPCKRSWDYAAMDSITREGCYWVLNEVFEGDPNGFIQRGDVFFALMPLPDSERSLSEHSPLRMSDQNGGDNSDL